MKLVRAVIAMSLLLTAEVAFGSPDTPCSLSSTVMDAKVTISVADGRSSFREGEIIPLELSFTASTDNRYRASHRNYDRSGRLNIDVFCVEPTVPDPLVDYFRSGWFLGGGIFSEEELSKKPFVANAQLNEWRQPGPGHYRLYVVSYRVSRVPDQGETTPSRPEPETLRSNTIEFDVVKAEPESRAAELDDAVRAYEKAAAGQDREPARDAARRLRFLNTRESAETLARLYWALNDEPGGWDLMFGLFGSPYRAEAIAAMQREVHNPEHSITRDFLNTLTKLQIETDSAWDPPAYDETHPGVLEEYSRKRQAHERELMQIAVAAAIEAAPQKMGRARALTMRMLTESSDLLNAAMVSLIRKQLIAAWSDLPEKTRLELIEYRWAEIAGPEMLPILRDFVAGPAPDSRTGYAMARDAALQHIYEFDPDEGRSLILRDLRDPKADPSISLAKLLSAEELRPVVREAVGRIKKNDARELDYHLVEVYGDESALGVVKDALNEHIGQWGCDPQGAMLRYLLRVDPESGVKAVRDSLAARKETGCYRMLLQELGKSLRKVERVAISALDDEEPAVANDAAMALGQWGTARAESALWARLKRLHRERQGREDELRATSDDQDLVGQATALESTLVNSIATGTNWVCGPEKFERLRSLASAQQQAQIDSWSKEWEQGGAIIRPNWQTDPLGFEMLQYSNLDEEQLRMKLSQMPSGTKLLFQIWKPGQTSPPVSVEKQETVFEALRGYASPFGVSLEEKSDP